MRYLIWGIGKKLKQKLDKINFDEVIGFIDEKAGEGMGEFWGKPMIAPKCVLDFPFDYIVISSCKYFDEISNYCIFELGIDCKKILCLDYLLSKQKKIHNNSNIQLKYQDVLAMTRQYGKSCMIKEWLKNDILDSFSGNDFFNHSGYLFDINLHTASICIYQVAHKKYQPIGNEKYVTIGVGESELPYEKDNIGDNIAKYNTKINECTALYWIWKHSEAEYIGLNHYRRIFESEINHGWPLQAIEAIELLQTYDVIAAKPVGFVNSTVAGMLSQEICGDAFRNSWEILSIIFENKLPEEREAFKFIMNGSIMFPCNMFIMNREKVNYYCSWLFPILFELIDKVEIREEWDEYSKRVIGFWAERLFTVWLYLCNYKVKELPILVVGNDKPYGK